MKKPSIKVEMSYKLNLATGTFVLIPLYTQIPAVYDCIQAKLLKASSLICNTLRNFYVRLTQQLKVINTPIQASRASSVGGYKRYAFLYLIS